MTKTLSLCIGLWGALCAAAAAEDDSAKAELLAPPRFETVHAKALDWIATRGVTDPAALASIGDLWAQAGEMASAEENLERLVQTFALADAETRQFVEQLTLTPAPLVPPDSKPVLTDDRGHYYASNLRLYYGRYLVHREMFEEALEVLQAADLKEVVDPAMYLFCKATCEKRLLLKTEALATLEQLTKNTEGVPVRYATVATLMRYDLEALKEKSLGEISWKMEDVERRLKLARAGEKVQKVEDEIVSALDDIIKKIEEQNGGGGGGGGGAQNQSNQSGSPANDSSVKGATAPGEVDKKRLKQGSNWGNLDDKSRAKVKNLISRDFPAHYRQAVEEYFKKLANREAAKK
jgi:tetratricopeptide (TPR) repeat protein